MKNTSGLVLGCLSILLVLLPLAVPEQGLPVTLKADEPAYYLAALSLMHDRDLECDRGDIQRLMDAYPHLPVENLILMSVDNWETVRFGKPVVYSVLVAPLAAAFGARGMVAFNMVLLVAMIWLGFWYLRRWNDDWLAALFSASFFLLSLGFTYVFWLHPEILSMFGVMVCLYFALTSRDQRGSVGRLARLRSIVFSDHWRPLWSGAALALAVYNKPMFAAIGVPALLFVLRRRGTKAVAAWLLGAALALGAQAGIAQLLTETPTPYLGTSRAGLKIESPEAFEHLVEEFRPKISGAVAANHSSYSWLARVPKFFPRMTLENMGYFFVGRHTGLFVYMPFSLLCLVLFVLHERRDLVRWSILGALGAVALFFMIWMHYNWHGGAGFVGNRYFVSLYPAFLFLVTAVRPTFLLPIGYGLAGLFVAPLMVTVYGAQVPEPTLQAHTRGSAYSLLPQELSISAEVPGYVNFQTRGLALRARRDQFKILDRGRSSFAVRGAATVEVWLSSARPVEELKLAIASPAVNSVTLELNGKRQTIEFDENDSGSRELVLAPERPTKDRSQWGKRVFAYRLLIRTETGSNRTGPSGEIVYPQFYTGARISILGVRRAPA